MATDRNDDDDESTPKHFGDYRREKLKRLEETPNLEPVETFGTVDEMVEAIEEIHIPDYSTPPEDTIDKLQHLFGRLPDDEAERYYLNDYKLCRTVNAARRAFNEWVSRKKRYDQMPGWAEAGPSKYPKKKHKKRRDSERKGREELQEKLDRLNGRTKGAFRRALKKAGYSEAELNEQKRESERQEMRDILEKGDIVRFRNPRIEVGRVVRVNKKTVTVEYPNQYGDDGTSNTRVKLESEWLQKLPKSELVDPQGNNEDVEELREDLIGVGLLPEATEGQ